MGRTKMKIEEHWYDGVEYYIEFETSCKRVIRKNLILPTQLTDQEIEEIIMNRFRSVQKVLVVAEIQDVLLLKSGIVSVGEDNACK